MPVQMGKKKMLIMMLRRVKRATKRTPLSRR
jgi:hypothetical protein